MAPPPDARELFGIPCTNIRGKGSPVHDDPSGYYPLSLKRKKINITDSMFIEPKGSRLSMLEDVTALASLVGPEPTHDITISFSVIA